MFHWCVKGGVRLLSLLTGSGYILVLWDIIFFFCSCLSLGSLGQVFTV